MFQNKTLTSYPIYDVRTNPLIRVIISLLPLFLGGIMYLLFRVDSLRMFRWADNLGLLSIVKTLRNNDFINSAEIPLWIKFSLPDGLWILSLTQIILVTWDFTLTRACIVWILLTACIGLFSELGQLMKVVPGTFDVIDLLLIVCGLILPVITNCINPFSLIK